MQAKKGKAIEHKGCEILLGAKHVVHMTTVHHPFDTRIYHKECQSLQKAGHHVTLIAPGIEEAARESEINLIPIKKYRNRFLRMVLATGQVYRKARQLKADFYHIHDPELLPVARLLKRKNNVIIYDIHEDNVTSIMQKEYIPKPIRKLIASVFSIAERTLSRKLELCLAEKYYKDLYPRGKCILNYPILNQNLLRDEIDHRSIKDELIYTGNVTVERGAYIHARLPSIDPQISVHCIGKCPRKLAEQMFTIAAENKHRLTIRGVDQYVPREEIDASYISRGWLAGIALFPPSKHYIQKELTKFFEYMSAGIPIICSDFPVWKNFVHTYACGIAVNPDDEQAIKSAIDYLRNHPDEAKKMGKNGRKAVLDHLNWHIEEEKLIQWYDELWEKQIFAPSMRNGHDGGENLNGDAN